MEDSFDFSGRRAIPSREFSGARKSPFSDIIHRILWHFVLSVVLFPTWHEIQWPDIGNIDGEASDESSD
jgi:hypothetical protein